MKPLVITTLLLLCSITIAATDTPPKSAIDTDEVPNIVLTADTPETQPFKTYTITPNTYFIYGNIAEIDNKNRGFNGNAGFIITEAGVIVIDTLGSPKLGKRLINTIKSITDKPIKYIILTHTHPDHSYGSSAFKEAVPDIKVIGHEGSMEYLNSDRIDASVTYRKNLIQTDMAQFKSIKPDILVGGETFSKHSIELGGKTLDIYNTGKHHSFGDLVVHQQPENILWISDLAFNNRLTFMADGNSKQAIAAQTWALETFKDANFMIPGHGSVQTKPFPMLTKTRDYMQRLRTDMEKSIHDGIDLQTAVDKTHYTDWEKTHLYELNHKKNIDFVYRELELETF